MVTEKKTAAERIHELRQAAMEAAQEAHDRYEALAGLSPAFFGLLSREERTGARLNWAARVAERKEADYAVAEYCRRYVDALMTNGELPQPISEELWPENLRHSDDSTQAD